jgi:hypothetical protein
VGNYADSKNVDVPLAEHWNGKKWASQKFPVPPSLGAWLQGVSCTTAADCEAVGYYYYEGTIVTGLAAAV